jgi:hypothetical protein
MSDIPTTRQADGRTEGRLSLYGAVVLDGVWTIKSGGLKNRFSSLAKAL